MDMNLGGPVWHASVAGSLVKAVLESEAARQLAGVGEWREPGEKAFHIRRRLTAREQRLVGPVVDIRRSGEARMRAARLGGLLALAPPEVLAEEIGKGDR